VVLSPESTEFALVVDVVNRLGQHEVEVVEKVVKRGAVDFVALPPVALDARKTEVPYVVWATECLGD